MDSSFGLTGKDFVIICTDNSVAHSILKLKVLINPIKFITDYKYINYLKK